jgi:hypothetical protein
MGRRGDFRNVILLAAALAASLAPAAPAIAADPAADEYTLDVPTARDNPVAGAAVRAEDRSRLEQTGVAGESPAEVQSPLGSAVEALSPWVPLALLAALLGAAAAAATRRRPLTGTR